jgi:hypothetical protein
MSYGEKTDDNASSPWREKLGILELVKGVRG